MPTGYDTDFFASAEEQARLLRAGRCSQLAVVHKAVEEILVHHWPEAAQS